MGTYLEDYLESIYMLPSEVKRNFELMRELDKATSGLLDDLRESQSKYLKDARERIRKRCADTNAPEPTEEELRALVGEDNEDETNPSPDNPLAYLKSKRHLVIQKMDEKVAIASQSYDLIDHHIRRLDNDLANYTALLKANGEYEDEKIVVKKQKDVVPDTKATGAAAAAIATTTPNAASHKKSAAGLASSHKKSGRKRNAADAQLDAIPEAVAVSQPLTLEDLPIDPNEPLYCHCRRISYGQMIGCDNEDCKYEWFHFDCVGLTEQPSGAWYCKDCTAEMAA
ncbi:hypothetical protein LEN26_004021 [Aphanomyces euteiches]|uniref:Inhibitor of growth protein n=1 Tax=Aphanomyces euteiches TaxID=100861 RepID=A0A6G0WRI8_9STRA|nr:hypothetical protein Ae201684_012379 [Aphanomyces euteiches]KAH9090295.1 hypothetical protein Ae201684P_014102 [Aphanomyces euteiches]KAH9126226.1 hypothetical protein AeMF1_003326 [Aphanomyces euteiches]KAH9150743.1 hypothetical protein LEN26_004021 [Aphanomyces euteiches]KAH9154653.1 hypothetical protein AeRB84_003288 [Aphanomyces euteiches]